MATERNYNLLNASSGKSTDVAGKYDKIASSYLYATISEKLWENTTFYTFTNYVLERKSNALKGATVLDFGCGNGVYSRWAATQGASRVVGIDISEQQIVCAQEIQRSNPLLGTVQIEYIKQDVSTIDGANIGQFDVVIAVHVLCYAQGQNELKRMLSAASSCLKKGGRLVGVREGFNSASKEQVSMKVKGDLKGGPMFSYELMPSGDSGECHDFCACKFCFGNSDGSTFGFTSFVVSESTMVEMFFEAGFEVKSIGTQLSCSPEGYKLFPLDFIKTLTDDWGKIIYYFDVVKL